MAIHEIRYTTKTPQPGTPIKPLAKPQKRHYWVNGGPAQPCDHAYFNSDLMTNMLGRAYNQARHNPTNVTTYLEGRGYMTLVVVNITGQDFLTCNSRKESLKQ